MNKGWIEINGNILHLCKISRIVKDDIPEIGKTQEEFGITIFYQDGTESTFFPSDNEQDRDARFKQLTTLLNPQSL